jgi:hypothetical protein
MAHRWSLATLALAGMAALALPAGLAADEGTADVRVPPAAGPRAPVPPASCTLNGTCAVTYRGLAGRDAVRFLDTRRGLWRALPLTRRAAGDRDAPTVPMLNARARPPRIEPPRLQILIGPPR